MKVISLLQPFASLVAMGAKKIETRSWDTDYRGPILIHASKGKYIGKGLDRISCRELCYYMPFAAYIKKGMAYDKLPFGAIIGQATIVWSASTEELIDRKQFTVNADSWYLSEVEKDFGDYSENRFGWLLKDAKQWKHPVPAAGKLGIWSTSKELDREIFVRMNY